MRLRLHTASAAGPARARAPHPPALLEPGRARALGCAALLGAAVLAGCAARRTAEVQRRLIGVATDALEQCLGAPSSSEELDGRGVWIYEALYSGAPEAAALEITREPGSRPAGPAGHPGEPLPAPPGDTEERTAEEGGEGDAAQGGTCVLVFELQNGAVRRFRSAGRHSDGSDAAADCALLARRCEPESPD